MKLTRSYLGAISQDKGFQSWKLGEGLEPAVGRLRNVRFFGETTIE